MIEEKKFIIKCYSKKELADLYHISAKTFRKWLKVVMERYPDVFPQKERDYSHLLTPAQVAKFVEHHGEP